MSAVHSISQLASSLALIDLHLVVYRGCFISSEAFSEQAVNSWLDETGGDCRAVERVLNHVHFYDCIDQYDDSQLEELEALARKVMALWTDLLRVRHPERTFAVTFATEPDEYGPTVTLCQA